MGISYSYACTSPTAVTVINYNASSNCMYEGQAFTIPANFNCNVPAENGQVYGYTYLTCSTGVPSSSTTTGGLRGTI